MPAGERICKACGRLFKSREGMRRHVTQCAAMERVAAIQAAMLPTELSRHPSRTHSESPTYTTDDGATLADVPEDPQTWELEAHTPVLADYYDFDGMDLEEEGTSMP